MRSELIPGGLIEVALTSDVTVVFFRCTHYSVKVQGLYSNQLNPIIIVAQQLHHVLEKDKQGYSV